MASNFYLSANMNLPIPTIGQDPGPDYAANINSAFTLVDSHNHSAGQGAQINPAGININSDLAFNNNNIISARSLRFLSQGSPISGALDLGCIYESGVDLYYNDGNGNQVRITQSGGVAGSPGSIANLTSPASATYVAADETFVWQSGASIPANLDAGSVIIRNITAGSNGITLSAPNALASSYSLILPSLPSMQSFMTLDNSGNIGASWSVDGSTIVVNSNVVEVAAGGITSTQIAANTIVAANIAAGTITGTQIAAVTIAAGNIIPSTITANEISGTTLTAGIYTPILQAGSINLTQVIPREAQFIRILNIVSVAARIDFQPTAAGGFTFSISLPFTTSFTSTTQGNGVFSTPNANIVGIVAAASSGSIVTCSAAISTGLGGGLSEGNFVFSYRII